MPSGGQSWGLTPPMPRGGQSWGLTPPMPSGRESWGLTPPMPRGGQSWGLTPPMPRGRESRGLTPPMPRGRESRGLTLQVFQRFCAWSPLSMMGSKLGAAGLCFSCVATVLLAVSAATESWLRLWVLGIIIHRGLWRECQLEACTPLQGQRAYVGVSRGCLVLALVASYLSVVCGALALAPRPAPKRLDWARGAAALCFLTGTLAVVALGCFMGGSAGEAGGSWAWSLAVGWAAVPAAGLAGTCHCQARRREPRWHSGPRGSPGSA
ncbi:lens fiber membrane intrinsic protein-like [Caretta caretta]|uniref:lens fiber membrane intrinsic protein-like n=1 Tax=Caretta caretta TaxID=8467 RepID=UPI003F4BBF16